MGFYWGKYRIEPARLRGYDYSSPGSYFVTICTKRMIRYFGECVGGEMKLSSIGEIIAVEWKKTPVIRPDVAIDDFVVMPNHMHGIIVIGKSNSGDLTDQVPFADIDDNVAQTTRGGKGMSIVETTRRVVSTGSILTSNSLGSIIGQFKSICTKRIRKAGLEQFAWQPRYYDRIIRDEAELDRIREYIISNPINWNSDEYHR